jgi:hypothetical protein
MAQITCNLETKSAPFNKQDFVTSVRAGKLPSVTTIKLQRGPQIHKQNSKKRTSQKNTKSSAKYNTWNHRKIIVQYLTMNIWVPNCNKMYLYIHLKIIWGTALQTGRWRVQSPIMSLEFFIDNPSGRTMALGSTQPLTEISTRNISW